MSKLHDGIASVDLEGEAEDVVGVASALRIFVGYAGWSPGQLDDELTDGAWWVVSGSRSDLFSDEPELLWSQVLRRQRPPLAFFATYPDDPTQN
jgi:putative transcriptional regulator